VPAGRRGDTTAAAELAAQAERVLLAGGLPLLLAQVQLARGTAALGAGRHDEAYEQLARIFDPQEPAYHPHVRAWALVDLAEAAAAGGHQDAARRHHAGLIPEAAATGLPLLRASLAVAAPMLATDDAQALFDAAFGAGLADWPPKGWATGRSASSCTCHTAPSATTCTGSSPSSVSPRAPNWPPLWAPPKARRRAQPLRSLT
jgi:hypothetical protein